MANWIISVGWYSVFGHRWAALVGRTPEWKFEPAKVVLGLAFNVLTAIGMAIVIGAAGTTGAANGMLWGLAIGILIVLPAHSGKWTWEDKPMLLAIDAGAHIVALAACGAIIGAWSAR